MTLHSTGKGACGQTSQISRLFCCCEMHDDSRFSWEGPNTGGAAVAKVSSLSFGGFTQLQSLLLQWREWKPAGGESSGKPKPCHSDAGQQQKISHQQREPVAEGRTTPCCWDGGTKSCVFPSHCPHKSWMPSPQPHGAWRGWHHTTHRPGLQAHSWCVRHCPGEMPWSPFIFLLEGGTGMGHKSYQQARY